jgi:hypothetical protein
MANTVTNGIVGRRIVAVRSMTPAELVDEGWPHEARVPAIVLDDGTVLYASRDDEGNGPGAIFGTSADGGFYVTAPR